MNLLEKSPLVTTTTLSGHITILPAKNAKSFVFLLVFLRKFFQLGGSLPSIGIDPLCLSLIFFQPSARKSNKHQKLCVFSINSMTTSESLEPYQRIAYSSNVFDVFDKRVPINVNSVTSWSSVGRSNGSFQNLRLLTSVEFPASLRAARKDWFSCWKTQIGQSLIFDRI